MRILTIEVPTGGDVEFSEKAFLGTAGGEANESLRGFGATSQIFSWESPCGWIVEIPENGGVPIAKKENRMWEWCSRSAYSSPSEPYRRQQVSQDSAYYGGRWEETS